MKDNLATTFLLPLLGLPKDVIKGSVGGRRRIINCFLHDDSLEAYKEEHLFVVHRNIQDTGFQKWDDLLIGQEHCIESYDIMDSKEHLSPRETLLLKERVLDKKIDGAIKLCDKALAHLGADEDPEKSERQGVFEEMKDGLEKKTINRAVQDRVAEKELKISNLEDQLKDNFHLLNGHRISATPFFKGLIEFGIKVPAKAIGNMLAAASNTVLGTNFNTKSPLVTPFWRTKSVETVKDIKDVIYDRKSSFQK